MSSEVKYKEYIGLQGRSTFFHEDTPLEVCRVIDDLMQTDLTPERVRVWYGDRQTGRSWDEENMMTGRIGRSTGRRPIPLLVHNRRSMGGSALLTDCIVKIQRTDTREVLYRHPTFYQAHFTVEELPKPFTAYGKTYTHRVLANGQEYANTGSRHYAERLAAFMNGERMSV